ncbi:hypothetical protein [Bergeyella cardium]|uniref:Uncharacterized protein n=1 Tax=Bergeyella cardium TaxID=1585976 RepID=A0A6P1QS40_9FLAO|nr:hypothetical protein [Bergeyella cardium]QHN64599.1 hypothetical protein DBX24_01165 [Bergeyella cardium]WHE33892.1 hypothetical protein P8603_01165 [Bergeyella cardium]WHF60542.1 hypothetical protein O0R51_01165 [Bergeyella cardium]
MKISQVIIEKIKTDNEFSIELAKVMKVQQQSVIGLARRNSSKLSLYQAVLFYKEKGYSEEQIFEKENQLSKTSVK